MEYVKDTDEGCEIQVYVQPNAPRTEIVGEHEGRLKIKVQSPPVEGAANRQCCKFLASLLNVSKSKVRVIRGERQRFKTLAVFGKKAVEVNKTIHPKPPSNPVEANR